MGRRSEWLQRSSTVTLTLLPRTGRRVRYTPTGGRQQLPANGGIPSSEAALLSSSGGATAEHIAASATPAGLGVSTIIPGAATKAAVSGRTFIAWQCTFIGPAQAAADDTQQFLGFGVSLGEDAAGGEGVVRGALILTSGLRIVGLIILMLVARGNA